MGVLGIDLGTSNSAAAFQRADGAITVVEPQHGGVPYGKAFPSCVQYTAAGEFDTAGVEAWRNTREPNAEVLRYMKRIIGKSYAEIVGDLARLRALRDRGAVTGSLAFLELLSDRFLEDKDTGGLLLRVGEKGARTAVEATADLLKYIRKESERRAGEQFDSAVVCVPSYFGPDQVEATKQAAEKAFAQVTILTEPKAAALAAGAGREGRELVVVYDLGGGTLDVVVGYVDATDPANPNLDISAEMGDSWLGGIDVDGLLLEQLLARDARFAAVYPQLCQYERNDALFNLERTKIALSTQSLQNLWFNASGPSVVSHYSLDI